MQSLLMLTEESIEQKTRPIDGFDYTVRIILDDQT